MDDHLERMQRLIDLPKQIACVEREIERVYSRWVAAGKMKQEKADYEITAMRAVLQTLKAEQTRSQPALFTEEPKAA
jgi:hypothetical protein